MNASVSTGDAAHAGGSPCRISEKLLADLATVWEEHGQSVRTPGNLDPDEWAILRRVIELIKQNASGAELGPVLETIENALRADKQS